MSRIIRTIVAAVMLAALAAGSVSASSIHIEGRFTQHFGGRNGDRPKGQARKLAHRLRGEECTPARARRRAWFKAREAGVDKRLADRQVRRSRPICSLRRDSEDEGNDAPPAIRARFERAKQYFLPDEPLSEPLPPRKSRSGSPGVGRAGSTRRF